MTEFYIKIEGEERGPYSVKEVRNMHLSDNVMVKMVGGYEWKPAGMYNFERMMAQELMKESRQNLNQHEEDLSDAAVMIETKRWNWGACLLPCLWGAFHGVWWPLITMPLQTIPILRIVAMIVMGSMGGRKAWERKHWEGVKHYMRVQHDWAIAGVIVFVVRIFIEIWWWIFSWNWYMNWILM